MSWRVPIFFLISTFLFGQGDLVGTVSDLRGNGIPWIEVHATHESGTLYQTLSDQNGDYGLHHLPAGRYLVKIKVPPQWEVLEPECGWEIAYVRRKQPAQVHFKLGDRTGGVAIDFGSPTGAGTLIPSTTSQFFVTLHLSNVSSAAAPSKIIVDGYWYAPGAGQVFTAVLNGAPAGSYGSDLGVNYINYSSGKVSLIIEKIDFPHMDDSGALATYGFEMSSAILDQLKEGLGSLNFCVDHISFEHSDEILPGYMNDWFGKPHKID